VLITGLLRQKWVDAFASEQAEHATSARLAAALDQVDIGIDRYEVNPALSDELFQPLPDSTAR
jgi:hypothetical protein